MGQALSGSRNLFALAEQGDLPPFFGRVHPRYRTPINAILVTAAVALVLAVSGTFQTLAAASAISRLVVYVATCASTLRLRTPVRASVPAVFTVPFGPVIPLLAIVFALAILAGAQPPAVVVGDRALAAGALLYLIAIRGRQTTQMTGEGSPHARHLMLCVTFVLLSAAAAAAQPAVFLVRHAERADAHAGGTQ